MNEELERALAESIYDVLTKHNVFDSLAERTKFSRQQAQEIVWEAEICDAVSKQES